MVVGYLCVCGGGGNDITHFICIESVDSFPSPFLPPVHSVCVSFCLSVCVCVSVSVTCG